MKTCNKMPSSGHGGTHYNPWMEFGSVGTYCSVTDSAAQQDAAPPNLQLWSFSAGSVCRAIVLGDVEFCRLHTMMFSRKPCSDPVNSAEAELVLCCPRFHYLTCCHLLFNNLYICLLYAHTQNLKGWNQFFPASYRSCFHAGIFLVSSWIKGEFSKSCLCSLNSTVRIGQNAVLSLSLCCYFLVRIMLW